MKPIADASIIIPAYGPSPFLQELLSAIKSGSVQPAEIIVSHSASDNPADAIGQTHPDVKVLHSEPRLFAGAARNRGAQAATSPVLIFCDNDVVPQSDWLERLLEAIGQSEERFVVGAVGTARSGGYWGMSTWICEFSEQAPWRNSGTQRGGASCNMAIRKAHFMGVGQFDETMTPGEDTILFYRLRQMGLEQWLATEACVDHQNRNGFAEFYRHQFSLGRHFAKVRKIVPMEGHQVIRWPIISAGLWIPKVYRVLRRLLPRGMSGLALAALYFPAIVLGSMIWSYGCLQGVLAEREAGRRRIDAII